jgi:formylmethanofuran dehydrogenase subunit E
MEKVDQQGIFSFEMDSIPIQNNSFIKEMGHRVCDNCGEEKDTSGGKSCKNGHFICHSCASRHEHCPLCKHTLR